MRLFAFLSLCAVLIVAGSAMGRGLMECRNDNQIGCEKPDEIPAAVVPSAQEIAEALPVDYIELVYPVIADFVRAPSYYSENHIDLYLTVFGEDPFDALWEKVSDLGLEIQPGSALDKDQYRGDGGMAQPSVRRFFLISILGPLYIDENNYRVIVKYYCEPWCGGDIEYTLRFNGEIFEIVDRDQLTIA